MLPFRPENQGGGSDGSTALTEAQCLKSRCSGHAVSVCLTRAAQLAGGLGTEPEQAQGVIDQHGAVSRVRRIVPIRLFMTV